jgi:hypothetical protein
VTLYPPGPPVTAIGIRAPALFFLKNGVSGFLSADLNPVAVWKCQANSSFANNLDNLRSCSSV